MKHPAVVIRCDHGHRGGKADVIQRFQWTVSEERWIPTMSKGITTTSLRGNEVDDWLNAEADAPIERVRQRVVIPCFCGERVRVASDDDLQDVFRLLAFAAQTPAADFAGDASTRELLGMLLMHRSEKAITLTLSSLRLVFKYRNKIYDTLSGGKRIDGEPR